MSTAASASNNPSQPAGKLTSLSHKGGFDWDLEIGFGVDLGALESARSLISSSRMRP